mgnify:CR=1 FL=1
MKKYGVLFFVSLLAMVSVAQAEQTESAVQAVDNFLDCDLVGEYGRATSSSASFTLDGNELNVQSVQRFSRPEGEEMWYVADRFVVVAYKASCNGNGERGVVVINRQNGSQMQLSCAQKEPCA